MNWLAHLYLSEPTPAFRVGNLLPDLLCPAQLNELPAEFQRGIECHRAIDCFTDAHPVFRRSARRISPAFRRFGGILADMFYDHFLAREWERYGKLSLERFVSEIHASFEICRPCLCPAANARLRQIAAAGWLCSYQRLDGIHRALVGIGFRFRKPLVLGPAIMDLERHYEEFRGDFAEFFPEVQAHVSAMSA